MVQLCIHSLLLHKAARKGLAEEDASRKRMDEKVISRYFAKINEKYNLKTAVGVEAYINDMKRKM